MRFRKTLSFVFSFLPLALLFAYVLSRIFIFASIFDEHSGVALSEVDAVRAHNASHSGSRPQLIPKIIHQVYHNWKEPGNDTLPADWATTRQTCIDLHPRWEHMLWTEKTSRDFIAAEYPWFLDTYDGYRYPVQRVDAIRYFLVLHYGGIYIDLDNGCAANLEPLLYYPVWIADPGWGALQNNILAARPNHPFWSMLTQALVTYDHNFIFPYVTVSYASGQWFETEMWERYHGMLPKTSAQENRLFHLVVHDRETEGGVFFTQERGGTWKNWDSAAFLWVASHIVLLTVSGCALIGVATWGVMRGSYYARRRSYVGYKQLVDMSEKTEEYV